MASHAESSPGSSRVGLAAPGTHCSIEACLKPPHHLIDRSVGVALKELEGQWPGTEKARRMAKTLTNKHYILPGRRVLQTTLRMVEEGSLSTLSTLLVGARECQACQRMHGNSEASFESQG